MKRKIKNFVLDIVYTYPLIVLYTIASIVVCIWLLATPVDMEMYSVITKTWATAALILIALEARNHHVYTEDIDEEYDEEYDKCA